MKQIDYRKASWDEIIPAVLRNDKQAQTALVEKTKKMVTYNCFKFAKGDQDLTEDLMQDVYIKIFTNLPSLKDSAAFPSWAKLITCHTCQDYLRKENRSPITYFAPGEGEDEDDPYETYADQEHQVSPEKKLDNKETRDMMKEIIQELPEAQRSAIILYYYDDLSVNEIAEMSDVPESTVKSRLNYGRKKIKEGVEEYQKKHGIKLYSATPASFLLYISHFLKEESSDLYAAAKFTVPTALIIKQATGTAATTFVKGAVTAGAIEKTGLGFFLKGIVSSVSAKAAIAVSAVIVAVGTVIGVSYTHQNKPVESPVAEISSSIQTSESSTYLGEPSLPEESSSPTVKPAKEESKAESEISSEIEESSSINTEASSVPIVIDETPVQEESSANASFSPEESMESSFPVEAQDSSVPEESSLSEEKTSSVVEESSVIITEEVSSSAPTEESSEKVTCVHQHYTLMNHEATCSQDGFYEYDCYDCGAHWTTTTTPALGGTCDNPTEPWVSVGDVITKTQNIYAVSEQSVYTDGEPIFCTKCGCSYSGLWYEMVRTSPYFVEGTPFDDLSSAKAYANENGISTLTVQYTVQAITEFSIDYRHWGVKLPEENRPPV